MENISSSTTVNTPSSTSSDWDDRVRQIREKREQQYTTQTKPSCGCGK